MSKRPNPADMAEDALLGERRDLDNKLKMAGRELARMRGRMSTINRELDIRRNSSARDISITDHALILYLERVKGIDVDAVRQEIRNVLASHRIGVGAATILRDGVLYRIDRNIVVTVFREGGEDEEE